MDFQSIVVESIYCCDLIKNKKGFPSRLSRSSRTNAFDLEWALLAGFAMSLLISECQLMIADTYN